jgi:hypothetical protein
MEMIDKHGIFLDMTGTILTNFADDAPPCTARKGDTCINVSIAVPAEMEVEVDALWAEHETFMRNTHAFDTPPVAGNDMKAPRITQFIISKASSN